jgi:hypothetical protein
MHPYLLLLLEVERKQEMMESPRIQKIRKSAIYSPSNLSSLSTSWNEQRQSQLNDGYGPRKSYTGIKTSLPPKKIIKREGLWTR